MTKFNQVYACNADASYIWHQTERQEPEMQVLKSPVGAVVTHPSLSLRIWQPVMQQLTAYFPYPHWAQLQKSALAAMQACM